MPTEKPFEELNVEELRELMDVATAAKALGAKDPLPAGITIDSVQQRITELLDTGHYDDGHSFGWKQSDPDAGELDTGHYDDGHSFGWKQSDPGAGDATGSGVNWLAVGGILAAVVAAIVAFVLLMGGGDDADQKAASEDAAQVGADDDETTGPPEPSIVEMRATFAKPKTTYSVTVAPLERQYTYRWSFDGSRCGSFSDATKPTWVWDHPHTGEKGACPEIDPEKGAHPGTITVLVSDQNYECRAVYREGSKAGLGFPDRYCTARRSG